MTSNSTSKTAVVYHSGNGHTHRTAEAVAKGAGATLRMRTDVPGNGLSMPHVRSLILKLKGVTGVPPLSGACKGADLDKLVEVACRRCPRWWQ